ncbi:MAG TPA: hypothetical protein VF510_19690 [Ktedonobacterales bacterium]
MKPTSIVRTVGSVAGAGIAVAGVYRFVIRPWHLRWGATDAEVMRALPGDEEVQDPTLVTNRAVTIQVPPEDIWPWLAQIGKGRAGFYSYEWIENLMGLDIKNSERILPEFQELKAGDMIPDLGPVKAVEPDRYWLLAGHENWGDVSWVMALEPLDAQQTRLISRTRYNLRWGPLLRGLPPQMVPFYLFFEPGEFVMVRKMLLGIKRRAETLAERQHARVESAHAARRAEAQAKAV